MQKFKRLIELILTALFSKPFFRSIVSSDPYSFFQDIFVKIRDREVIFFGFGAISIWRAKTLFTKEPETIEWIDGFQEGEVLWDIGANVGIYSVYAGCKSVTVVAFEPSSANYFILNRNINRNRLSKKVFAYPIALSNENTLGLFQMNADLPGGALNYFSKEDISEIQAGTKSIPVNIRQAMISYSIDEFIAQFNPPFPNYIKLDVDGIEDKIIDGARDSLKDKRLKSILVELDESNDDFVNYIQSRLEVVGFILEKKCQSWMYEKTPFSRFFNYIYIRR